MKTDRETESGKTTYGPLTTETEEEWKNYTLTLEQERGEERKKSKSRDLSKRSLKTDKETDSREPTQKSLKRERGYTEEEQRPEQQVSEDRQGDRQQGTYTGIDIRKSMSRDLSNGSLKTERQRAENLHSNLFKRREGERGKEQVQRSEQQVSEDRRGCLLYTSPSPRDTW